MRKMRAGIGDTKKTTAAGKWHALMEKLGRKQIQCVNAPPEDIVETDDHHVTFSNLPPDVVATILDKITTPQAAIALSSVLKSMPDATRMVRNINLEGYQELYTLLRLVIIEYLHTLNTTHHTPDEHYLLESVKIPSGLLNFHGQLNVSLEFDNSRLKTSVIIRPEECKDTASLKTIKTSVLCLFSPLSMCPMYRKDYSVGTDVNKFVKEIILLFYMQDIKFNFKQFNTQLSDILAMNPSVLYMLKKAPYFQTTVGFRNHENQPRVRRLSIDNEALATLEYSVVHALVLAIKEKGIDLVSLRSWSSASETYQLILNYPEWPRRYDRYDDVTTAANQTTKENRGQWEYQYFDSTHNPRGRFYSVWANTTTIREISIALRPPTKIDNVWVDANVLNGLSDDMVKLLIPALEQAVGICPTRIILVQQPNENNHHIVQYNTKSTVSKAVLPHDLMYEEGISEDGSFFIKLPTRTSAILGIIDVALSERFTELKNQIINDMDEEYKRLMGRRTEEDFHISKSAICAVHDPITIVQWNIEASLPHDDRYNHMLETGLNEMLRLETCTQVKDHINLAKTRFIAKNRPPLPGLRLLPY